MIHLVYPYDERRIAAPWSIGNHLAAGLRAAGHDVAQYDWAERRMIRPVPGDMLIGHPHPAPGLIFEASAELDGWARVVAMTPWGGLADSVSMIGQVAALCDRIVLICGPYWAERVPPLWWAERCVAVDMAIDRDHYPRVKALFSPPGQRRALYIGCAAESKGIDLLPRLGVEFDHVGYGDVPGAARHLGYVDFATPEGLALIADYDLLLAPGKNDANPTTVLEAASWGLIALCTPQSGWADDVAVHIPRDDDAEAGRIVRSWLSAPDGLLAARRRAVDAALASYTWGRFVRTILRTIR